MEVVTMSGSICAGFTYEMKCGRNLQMSSGSCCALYQLARTNLILAVQIIYYTYSTFFFKHINSIPHMLSQLVPLILQNITNYIMMFYIIHTLTSHLNFLSTQTASQCI